MNEYIYKKGIALGGDDGIIVINCKIPKLSIESPKLSITIETIGEGGKNQTIFSDTSFIELLRMYISILEKDLASNLERWKIDEMAMVAQAELLDPEKMKMDFLRQVLNKKVENVGQNNNSDVRSEQRIGTTK